MKNRLALLFLLLLPVTFVFACKGMFGGGETKLVLTYKMDKNAAPITKELAGKQSIMTVNELTTTAEGQAARIVRYSFYLANYDSNPTVLEREMPSAENQIRVEIEVVGPEGSNVNTPLKTGTYAASQFTDGVNKFNKALDVRVNLFDGGKVLDQGISTVNPRKGFVKINSVDEETVTGEVEMSDDFRSVKGSFSAKIVK
jgi:hypothetical protein